MKLLSRKYLVEAGIEHVIHCFTGLESLAEAVSYIDQGARVKPIIKSDGLYLVTKEPMIKITQFSVDAYGVYRALLKPIPDPLSRFGGVTVSCRFSEVQSGTYVMTTLEAEKKPNLFLRIFVRFIVLALVFQSRADEKKYILWVEKNA